MKRLDEIHLLGTSFTMCVEEWPNGGLRSLFTVLILCSQYILPVIVLPSFYYNVRIILSANCYSFWFITRHCVQILTYLQEQQEDSFGEERKLKKLTLILAFLAIIFAVVQKVSTFIGNFIKYIVGVQSTSQYFLHVDWTWIPIHTRC